MSAEEIVIGDVEKFSIVDYPEHMAAVVFMQGCPWRCPFCYNTSLQKIGGEPESDWTFAKLMNLLEKRKGVLDAVVFSGGEPLVQGEALESAIDAVKALGYKVGLHTGGYRPEILERIVEKVDWVGLDIKAPFEVEKYKTGTGGYTLVENVRRSLKILVASGKHFECRTTCDPRILTVEDIYKIAESLKAVGVQEYYLQKYRPIPSDKTTTDEQCLALVENQDLAAYLQKTFPKFEIRK